MQIFNSSGCRNHSSLHGGWDTHSSPLSLKTQHQSPHLDSQVVDMYLLIFGFHNPLTVSALHSQRLKEWPHPCLNSVFPCLHYGCVQTISVSVRCKGSLMLFAAKTTGPHNSNTNTASGHKHLLGSQETVI
jgi:hypothetical protein